MIYFGDSNTVMSFEVMKELGFKVDTTQGRCYAMGKREVTIIGTITALPYKLSSYHNKELSFGS